MRKILVLLMAVLMVIVLAAPIAAADGVTANLMIGRHGTVNAGTVNAVYDVATGIVTVSYTVDPSANGGWSLSGARVFADINSPTKSAPGKLPYVATQTENPNIWTCSIPLIIEEGQPIYVAAYAELKKTVEVVDPVSGETVIQYLADTGWAQLGNGLDIPIPPGKNWATYFMLNTSAPSQE